MHRHDYQSAADLRGMQDLLQRLWSPLARWHVGDLAWGRTAIPDAASGWMTALWTEASRVMAWAWLETPDELSLVVDPEQVGLVDEVLAWAVEVATGQELCCSVLETEGHLIEALTGAGFEPVDGGPFFTHHTMSLTELDDPVLEEGFTLRHVEPREAGERAACHRTAWSDFGSRVSARSYGQVMNTWPYRPGLDWVVQAPDGEMVANALGWIDDVNGVGLLEPVGCSPAFRRRGLAKAVNRAVLGSLRDAGATTAVVGPRGDADYPVPAMLYRSIGFEPAARIQTFRRTRTP